MSLFCLLLRFSNPLCPSLLAASLRGSLCIAACVTRFFLTQICFYYSILLLAQTACMWLTILQLNCQSPVSCHERQKFEAVLASEAKSKEGNEIQHSGLFNVARGSIVQRL